MPAPTPTRHDDDHSPRYYVLLSLLIVLAVVATATATLQWLRPLPPRQIVMTTGAPGGAYHLFGQRYQAQLARHGITVKLIESEGAVENLRRLRGADGHADVGILQAGVAPDPDAPDVVSLAALYYEPVWVFLRASSPVRRLADLAGLRVATGVAGSGTQLLALQLLGANGIAPDDAGLQSLTGAQAAADLRAGALDAAFFVAGARSPLILELLADPTLRPLSFDHADAYTRRFPNLNRVVLPRGTIDLVAELPRSDIVLIAPTANLVANAELHPAVISLLMQTAQNLHRPPGLFERSNEFPALRDFDYPLSPEAQRFFKSGPPLLQRYLPFWAAVLLDRLLWTLLPALALLVPTLRLLPSLWRWRVRARIYRWYGELKFLEETVRRAAPATPTTPWLKQLDQIEEQARRRKIPLSFANELYVLREHIDLVRKRVHAFSNTGVPPA